MRIGTLITGMALALVAATGCRAGASSPLEIVLQFERSVEIVEGRARAATRLKSADPAEVLLNVRCEGTDRTVTVVLAEPSDALCGLSFELLELVQGEEGPTAAKLRVSWGEGSGE